MAAANGPPQDEVFTSWKEISAYLGKSVRTVQRWEAEYGLPVRRPHDEANTICVSRDELSEWLVKRWSYRPSLKTPQPSNGARASSADLEEHCKLQGECCQLVAEVRRNMQMLVEVCRTLSQLVAHSRLLRLHPVFSVVAEPRTNAPARAKKLPKPRRKKRLG